MPSQRELASVSIPPSAAYMLGQQAVTALSAAGTNQATAYVIKSSWSEFTTVGNGQGAILPTATGQPVFLVANNGLNALLVYPAVGQNFVGAAANAPVLVPAGKNAAFYSHETKWMANISA